MTKYIILSVLIIIFSFSVVSADEARNYRLEVSIDIESSSLMGAAAIDVRAGEDLNIHRGDLHIESISLNGRRINIDDRGKSFNISPPASGQIVIRYSGRWDRNRGFQTGNVIGDRGIFLTGLWYPFVDGLSRYHLSARLPHGFTVVSEAEEMHSDSNGSHDKYTFEFTHPTDNIHL
jgi:hypothetical protein